MKLNYILIVFCLSIFLASCVKEGVVNTPDFDVIDYKVTSVIDTSGNPVKQVTFNFSGDASLISFYSGLLGSEYAYRDGHILEVKGLLSSFTSNLASTGTQENQLSILVSTDFNGIYDITNVRAATWTNITDRYALNVRGASAALHSGTVDISDLLIDGKPIYFAFRYICQPQAIYGGNSTWRIRDFSLQSSTDLGLASLATHTTADWQLINYGETVNTGRGAAIESNGALRFNGNHQTPQIPTESWGITKGFTVSKIDLGPDRPIAIKSLVNPRLESYSFNYTTSGTYKVVFIASNASYQGQNNVIREIEITVP